MGLENCKFSLKMPQGMQYTLLEGQWLTFIKAFGRWVEESVLKRLLKASVFRVIADECTDITAMGELSVFCH